MQSNLTNSFNKHFFNSFVSIALEKKIYTFFLCSKTEFEKCELAYKVCEEDLLR